jgi:hypothetical protein
VTEPISARPRISDLAELVYKRPNIARVARRLRCAEIASSMARPWPVTGWAAIGGASLLRHVGQGRALRLCERFRRTAHRALGRAFKFTFGSGTGIRTLNLAVSRSLQPVPKWGTEFTA